MSGACQTLDIHPPLDDGPGWCWTATHRTPGGASRTIRFEGGPRERQRRTDRGDPFLLAILHAALVEGAPLRVRGAPISPTLLVNLDELQHAFHAWWDLPRIDIHADEERETPTAPDAPAIVAFSGGIDAAFTVHRHLTPGSLRRRRLAAAVLVHGFDVRPDDADGFRRVAARARALLDGTGLELLAVRTDLRHPGDVWNRSHGLALAAALTLLSHGSAAGLIGGSSSYRSLLLPWGSNPITDPFMGSRSFSIVHDGTHASRLEKVRCLAEWPEALRHLRSCWKSPQPDRNCGRCPKCVLSQALFRCVDLEPPCLDSPLSEEEFCAALRNFPPNDASDPELVVMRRHLAACGATGAWIDALDGALRRVAGP